MDLTGGESSNDSGNNARPPVKKRKRIRINVTHLSEEEKYLRKRFLGRERARRYRERKRETKGYVARPKGRPKNSQNVKTERLRFLLPSSGVLYRQVVVHVNGPSENTTDSPEVPATSSHETGSQELASTRTLIKEGRSSVTDVTSLKKANTNKIQSSLTKKGQQPRLSASSSPGRCEVVRNSSHLIGNPINMADSQKQNGALTNVQEMSTICIKQESSQVEKGDSTLESESTCTAVDPKSESSTDEAGHISVHTDDKTFTTSAESEQQELTKTLTKSKNAMFKQQNVKDFINFFPVDDTPSVEMGSSSGLQKQVEIVLQAKKLMSRSNLSDLVHTEKLKQTYSCQGTEGEKRSATEQLESKDTDENVSRQELKEKSVESVPTQAAGVAEVLISRVPAVQVNSKSTTPDLGQGGLRVHQASSNPQHSDLSQQQQKLIGTNANAQTLNTVDPASLSSAVNAGGKSDGNISNLSGIINSPNLQGSGLGVQGLIGSTGCQGLQGVSDPRLLQLVGLQNPSGIQNVPSLLGGLQGLTALQGVFGGLQGPTTPLTSPSGIVGLQGIQNLQAISGLQGLPGLHAFTGLQGLVSLQGIPPYPGIQGLQGVGVAGPHQVSQGLQALAALQGNAYLQNIAGTSGLIAGLSSQSGIFSQQGLLVPLNQDSTGSNGPVASDKEEKNKAVSEDTPSSDSKKKQPEQMVADNKEQSSHDTTSSSEGNPVSHTSTPSIPKASHQPHKGRSRRKQASPRCISKQWCLSERENEEVENEEQRESTFEEAGQQEHTMCAKDSDLARSSLMESAGRSACRAPADESPRPGAKLSKKVEELMSGTKPCQLNVRCSPAAEPADDESPSPQTWRRFLEREKQRSDRLREVEEQLAKLQAVTRQWQVASSKCLISTASQTDVDWLHGTQHEGVLSPQRPAQDEGSWESMVEAMDQREGDNVIHGQIQQGVVTSSGDSHFRNLSRDGSQHEAELSDPVPVIAEDRYRSSDDNQTPPQASSDDNQTQPQASSDNETRIVNRPFDICMRSCNKRKKTRHGPVRPVVLEQAPPTFGNDRRGSSDRESKERGDLFLESLESLPGAPLQSDTKYVLQVAPQDYSDGSLVAEVGETSEMVYDNVQVEPVQIPSLLSESSGDIQLSSRQGEHINSQLVIVPPWETQGLSKVERNRIRAREGMRRHREKLRQAKLASQIWWNQCVKPENTSYGELSPSKARSRKSKTSGVSGRMPCFEGPRKYNRSSGKQNATSEMFDRGSPLTGLQKKPFEVLAQVAVNAETDLNTKQEVLDSPNQVEVPSCVPNSEFGASSQHHTKGSLNPEKVGGVVILARKEEQIDFTQEPFRSMSLQERNRIRAREGMRRYRERLKQISESPSQIYKVGKSRRGRGGRKAATGREIRKPSTEINSVPAAEHLAELAKRHSGTLVSYSQSTECNQTGGRKRRRAASLQARQKLNFGNRGNADKCPMPTFGIDLTGHSADAESYKQNHVVVKTEPSLFGNPEQMTQEHQSEETNNPAVPPQRVPASMLQGSATGVGISDDCLNGAEMKSIKEEQGHSD